MQYAIAVSRRSDNNRQHEKAARNKERKQAVDTTLYTTGLMSE